MIEKLDGRRELKAIVTIFLKKLRITIKNEFKKIST